MVLPLGSTVMIQTVRARSTEYGIQGRFIFTWQAEKLRTHFLNHFCMKHVVLLMSVGPNAIELDRLRDFLDGVFFWEPSVKSLVFIDDALESRCLGERFDIPKGLQVHSIHHPRKGYGEGVWGGLAEGILLGLNWIASHESEAAMILKTDTDALVIAPFADRAETFFAAHPDIGLIGLYDRHCSGESRSFWPWNRAMLNHSLPVGTGRTAIGRRRLRWQMSNGFGKQRRILRRARANGYRWGEHCLGGAYLLRAQTVRDMQRRALLHEPEFWRPSLVGEDVIVAAYAKAAGWNLAGHAAEGQIFGIEYTGLPYPPEELEARGYSIIHSVKNHQQRSENAIREFFRSKRP